MNTLQFVQRLDRNQGAGSTDRVPQRNAGAVGVDLGRVQLKVARDGAGLCGEGLVGLYHIKVIDTQARFLQGFPGGRNRPDTHVLGVHAGMGIRHQPRHGLKPALLRNSALHQHHGRCRVVDAGGVAGRDRTVFFQEGWLEFCHVLERTIGTEVFVQLKRHIAFARLLHNRQNLILEVAGLGGAFSPVVAFNRQAVLVLARDAPFGRDVFRRDTHVDVVEGVMQSPHHHVDHLGIAHANAPSAAQAGIRGAAHVFGAAADGDVGITQHDRLRRRHDGLQARAAQAVDVEGRSALGAATVDGRHARQVHVLGLGVDDMAKHHMADFFTRQTGAPERLLDNPGGQLGRGKVLERTAKSANGGTDRAYNNNFT